MTARSDRLTRSFCDRVRRPIFISVLCVFLFSCSQVAPERIPSSRLDDLPRIILWAWERPENFEFLDTKNIGVAFLAQTLVMTGDDVTFRPRRQPLDVPPSTKLIAVTRIEARKQTVGTIALSDTQRAKLIDLILKTLELESVSAIQIDFDVALSEREFYRELLRDLNARLPDDVPLSITALASFCLGDRWMEGLAVDEAIPMIFRMGRDQDGIRQYLGSGADFREPLCRMSYGISLDEPVDMKFDNTRRIYLFNPRAWKEDDVKRIMETVRK